MRVLIADRVPDWFPAKLAEVGCEVRVDPTLEAEALTAALADFHPQALVVRSTRVQAEQLAASPDLELVLRAGAGVNTIDVDEATRRRIHVANCPGMNADAVAELTIGHLVNLDRRIADNVADLRAGRWAKKEYGKARGLKGRTLGLLGLGNIGQKVARIAGAMGMELCYWDPFIPAEKGAELGARKLETPIEVAREADALTIHLAEVPATRKLVGEDVFAAMKPGAYLINTSRAGIVDEQAMYRAIDEKGIRVALDVYWNEPPANADRIEDPAAKHPSIYGTHHIGASTQQAQDAVAQEAFRVLDTYRSTGEVLHPVNRF